MDLQDITAVPLKDYILCCTGVDNQLIFTPSPGLITSTRSIRIVCSSQEKLSHYSVKSGVNRRPHLVRALPRLKSMKTTGDLTTDVKFIPCLLDDETGSSRYQKDNPALGTYVFLDIAVLLAEFSDALC